MSATGTTQPFHNQYSPPHLGPWPSPQQAADLRLSMLTLLSRAASSKADVFAKSRPELPDQLRGIGEGVLAERLIDALERRTERTTQDSAI